MFRYNKKQPSIFIISFSPLNRDPRVQRQIRFLQDNYRITAAGFSKPDIQGIEFMALPARSAVLLKKGLQALRLKTGSFESYYWNIPVIRDAYKKLSEKAWRLIIANDLISLPLALKLARPSGAEVLVDAHEYEPLHFDNKWQFNFFYKAFWDYIAKEYLPQASAMTTVCESIANAYHKNYGVTCEVITNASYFHQLEPKAKAPNQIRMIHHGICNPSRRLESMIEMMNHLDERFKLDLMLVSNNERYYHTLAGLVKGKPNITIRDPVPIEAIIPVLNKYDLGLHLMSPEAFNNRMALPNKLFEFIQARLGVVIWPSPEMAKIVNQYGIGVVAEEYTVSSAVAALNRLTADDVQAFKYKSHAAAPILCAEQNREVLLNIVRRLIGT